MAARGLPGVRGQRGRFAAMSRSADSRRGIRLPELASTDRARPRRPPRQRPGRPLRPRRRGRHPGGPADRGDPRRRPGALPTARPVRAGCAGWPSGVPTALAVTSYDGIVVARSAFESSIHYRSAVLFGRCTPVIDDKEQVLDLITERPPARPGRGGAPPDQGGAGRHAGAVAADRRLVAADLRRLARGRPDDVAGPAWAGVVPLRQVCGDPLAGARPRPTGSRSRRRCGG